MHSRPDTCTREIARPESAYDRGTMTADELGQKIAQFLVNNRAAELIRNVAGG